MVIVYCNISCLYVTDWFFMIIKYLFLFCIYCLNMFSTSVVFAKKHDDIASITYSKNPEFSVHLSSFIKGEDNSKTTMHSSYHLANIRAQEHNYREALMWARSFVNIYKNLSLSDDANISAGDVDMFKSMELIVRSIALYDLIDLVSCKVGSEDEDVVDRLKLAQNILYSFGSSVCCSQAKSIDNFLFMYHNRRDVKKVVERFVHATSDDIDTDYLIFLGKIFAHSELLRVQPNNITAYFGLREAMLAFIKSIEVKKSSKECSFHKVECDACLDILNRVKFIAVTVFLRGINSFADGMLNLGLKFQNEGNKTAAARVYESIIKDIPFKGVPAIQKASARLSSL